MGTIIHPRHCGIFLSSEWLSGSLALLLLTLLTACEPTSPPQPDFRVSEALGGLDTEGYARATELRDFRFPGDHGPHPDYRNEWWYLTGNLRTGQGRHFGFQVTFFRIALQPDITASPSAWRTNQVWMAHMALSDTEAKRHQAQERFARQAVGLAGARAQPFRVWLEDWTLQEDTAGTWKLDIRADDVHLQLDLNAIRPILLQGDEGLSRKSAEPGNASYYYSIPRLETRGEIKVEGTRYAVTGLTWLDREWSTSALGPDQAGWDWFSLQLEDGRDLMYYRLRRKDGGVDAHSAGSLGDEGGLRRQLSPGQVSLEPLEWWQNDGIRYPVAWRMQLKGEPTAWIIRARFPDQEMNLSVRYWEGTVEVLDAAGGQPLGQGYLEMAGYAP